MEFYLIKFVLVRIFRLGSIAHGRLKFILYSFSWCRVSEARVTTTSRPRPCFASSYRYFRTAICRSTCSSGNCSRITYFVVQVYMLGMICVKWFMLRSWKFLISYFRQENIKILFTKEKRYKRTKASRCIIVVRQYTLVLMSESSLTQSDT